MTTISGSRQQAPGHTSEGLWIYYYKQVSGETNRPADPGSTKHRDSCRVRAIIYTFRSRV